MAALNARRRPVFTIFSLSSSCFTLLFLLLLLLPLAQGQSWTLRAPASPLWAVNPFVSWWLPCDSPTDCFPQHALGDKWVGMSALARIDEENFRLLGPTCTADVPPLPQVGAIRLSITKTVFAYSGRGVQVRGEWFGGHRGDMVSRQLK